MGESGIWKNEVAASNLSNLALPKTKHVHLQKIKQ